MLALGALWFTSSAAPPMPAPPETATAPTSEPPPPDSAAVRAELMRAANRLENSPCDKRLRAPLHDAVVAFLDDIRKHRRNPPDVDTALAVLDAVHAGVVQPSEVFNLQSRGGYLSLNYGTAQQWVAVKREHRFECDLGGAQDKPLRRSR